ncbi:helix-turn-helix domain-containing protein [Streptomyces chitinivorans]|uniref:Helix-turn-helix domain-containing protein n=1 Tax=Streptomyces chitinivorans TaxID=1257027 RepID=A0ABW7HQK1_9ACTN|nr:helix-turn-helix transcriptional regulator [Streptomyces chitinivorans]MDH2407635.1 helix-turn-helix transcriptional regulator [Streptomyces chitinivorans]
MRGGAAGGRLRRGAARARWAGAEYVHDEADRARERARVSEDLGRAVYGRRRALAISQSELARRAGMSQPQVSRLELGGGMPTLVVLARLARALDASFALTFDGGEPRLVFEPIAEPAPAEPVLAEPAPLAAGFGTQRHMTIAESGAKAGTGAGRRF